MSCQKAQGFLESEVVQVGAYGDAGTERRGRDEALALARAADRVVVARGKKVVRFNMKKAPPSDEELLAHVLGPTGNLRAPTLRSGKTLIVGFNGEAYQEVLGS